MAELSCFLRGTRDEPQGGTCLEGDALTVRRPLSMADSLCLSPLPPVVRRMVLPGVSGIRDVVIRTYLLYFADFLWLPDSAVTDVIYTARIRRS